MEKLELKFTYEKETKNCIRYREELGVKKRNTSQALVARPAQRELLGPSFELHPTGLTVIGKPTKEEYTEAFRRLELIEGAIHWWYGDLCLAYEGQYRAIVEIAEQSPYKYQTIFNDKVVASRYELNCRQLNLTFEHYRIAAPLDDRLKWLKMAETGDGTGKPWSTRELEAQIRKARRLPFTGTYAVLYADPPWEYEFSQSESRSIEAHYPTMTTEEICQLPIPAEENALLFLWATNPKIREALQVIEAWGFDYRTNMVWVKDKWGMGYYVRGQHELLLIARKGDLPPPDEGNRVSSVIDERRLEHSQKPDHVYEIIEGMYPGQRYIELFGRGKARKGWVSWGDEMVSVD